MAVRGCSLALCCVWLFVSAVLWLAIVDHRLAVVARAALSAVVAGRCDVSAVLRFGLLVRFYGLVCSVVG